MTDKLSKERIVRLAINMTQAVSIQADSLPAVFFENDPRELTFKTDSTAFECTFTVKRKDNNDE